MLPEGFKWESIFGAGGHGDTNALAYRGHQVARIDQRVGGRWFATLRYPDGRNVHRDCTSYATGRAGIEAWAERHLDALMAHADNRHEQRATSRGQSRARTSG